jgi:hypothetical protein
MKRVLWCWPIRAVQDELSSGTFLFYFTFRHVASRIMNYDFTSATGKQLVHRR